MPLSPPPMPKATRMRIISKQKRQRDSEVRKRMSRHPRCHREIPVAPYSTPSANYRQRRDDADEQADACA